MIADVEIQKRAGETLCGASIRRNRGKRGKKKEDFQRGNPIEAVSQLRKTLCRQTKYCAKDNNADSVEVNKVVQRGAEQ